MSILDELQGAGIPRPGGFRKFLYAFAVLVAFYVALNIFASLYVDWIWFENLGFLSVFIGLPGPIILSHHPGFLSLS